MNLCSRLSKILFSLTPFLFLICKANAADTLPKLDLKVAYPNLSFTRPVWMTEAPDGSHRQFVVEQDGRVWILPADRNSSEPKLFLDIADRRPHHGNEEGLLCLAFHPQFKTNGKFYVYYTQYNPRRSVLSEWQASKTNANTADPATERIVTEIPQPYENHNGSTLVFGSDNYLYVSLGDGGAANDPHFNGQNLNVLLAKILRIDVDSRTGKLAYGIPKDNPFVAQAGDLATLEPWTGTRDRVRPEIWALGLRNVWRMSFDRETKELWAADVGQNKWEEVDIITRGGNYGWNVRESFHAFRGQPAEGVTMIDPIIEYGHTDQMVTNSNFPNHSKGISITGGYVYRGKKFPALRGVYVYADFQMGTIWGLRYENGKLTADDVLVPGNLQRTIPSFGETSDGELYVLSFDGKIYEFVEAGK